MFATAVLFACVVPLLGILNGRLAKKEEIPWQVRVEAVSSGLGKAGGGAIYRNDIIITATHVVVTHPQNIEMEIRVLADNFKILAGSLDRTKGTWIEVEKFALFPKLKTEPWGDIALLKLKSPLTFNTTIQPIPLTAKRAEPGLQCKTSGWGFNGQDHPKLLSVGNYVTVDDKACKRLDKYMPTTTLCEQSSEKQRPFSITQPGDSGGPLFCRSDNNANAELFGITSMGEKATFISAKPVLALFADVAYFNKWINDCSDAAYPGRETTVANCNWIEYNANKATTQRPPMPKKGKGAKKKRKPKA